MCKNICSYSINKLCNDELFEYDLNINNFSKLFHLHLINNIDRNVLLNKYKLSNLLSYYMILKQ